MNTILQNKKDIIILLPSCTYAVAVVGDEVCYTFHIALVEKEEEEEAEGVDHNVLVVEDNTLAVVVVVVVAGNLTFDLLV